MEQIRQYPELYDKSNTLFKDKDAKYQAWKNVSQQAVYFNTVHIHSTFVIIIMAIS